MRNGGTLIAIATILATTGCGEGKLEVRSISSPLASGVRAVSFRVAEGRGQFALGNVGLALESFRKAAREDPGNVDALVGIAACYDRMGRFDLSRRNYESALAVAPRDPQVLAAFADSLDMQQRASEAAKVRQEIAERSAMTEPKATQSIDRAAAEQRAAAETPSPIIALTPVLPKSVADAVAAALAASDWPQTLPFRAAKPAPLRHANAESTTRQGPRLERLSMGEVALITTAGPQWRLQQDQVRAPKPTTGAAALRQAAVARSGIRLFNAARVDRLASRARTYLSNRGWTVASVGDLALPRSRSLILYPVNKRLTATRLAAQLGFAMQARADVLQVTVLLGRDAASLPMIKVPAG